MLSDAALDGIRSRLDQSGELDGTTRQGDRLDNEKPQMFAEPLHLLKRFIGFDLDFYVAANPHSNEHGSDPWQHFIKHGRFDNLRICPFDEKRFLAATEFDAEFYYLEYKDVADAKIDPRHHFINYGLAEGRRPHASRINSDEVTLWSEIVESSASKNSDDTILTLPLAEKLTLIVRASAATLAKTVFYFLRKSDVLYFREDLALLLAQAALQLRWAAVADSYLQAYDEGLPFSIPTEIASARTTHVYAVLTPHEYCVSRDLDFITLKSSRENLAPSARINLDDNFVSPFSATELPPVIAVELHNAIAVGGIGAVLTSDNVLLSSDLEENCHDQSLRYKSVLYIIGGPAHVALSFDRKTREILPSALSLLHELDTNYFHFLIEVVPRFVSMLDVAGRPKSPQKIGDVVGHFDKVIMRTGLPASFHQILATLATFAAPLSNLVYEVEPFAAVTVSRLWVVSDFHRFLIRDAAPRWRDRAFCGETLRLLRARLMELGSRAAIDATFVQRRNATSRQLCNRVQVEQAFVQIGFQLFDSGEAEFVVQQRQFRRSFLVVGESGAGMTNLLFCRPGTVAILLSNNNRYQDFISFGVLAAVAGVDLRYYFGVEVPQSGLREVDNDFFVDSGELVDRILEESSVGERSVLPSVFRALAQNAWEVASVQFEAGDGDRALSSITAAANEAVVRSDAVGMISGSDLLDGLTLEIGSRRVKRASGDIHRASDGSSRSAYIVTELYMIGGHARLLEDVFTALSEEEHHLILTGQEVPFGEVLRVQKDLRIFPYFLRGTASQKLESGIQILQRLRPAALFHFAHPFDATALAMMQPEFAERRIIIHHNDHTFALGRHVPGAIHAGLHQQFNKEARRLWGLDAALLPLSCQDEIEVLESGDGPFTTLTSGSSQKFMATPARPTHNYLELLRTRLGAREGYHIHIGPLSPEQRTVIDAFLTSFGWADRLIHIPFVRRLAQALRILKPHLYLSSYPVGGGKATVEAMACGIPICAAKGGILDGTAVGYDQMFTWENLGELQDILTSFDDELYHRHQRLALSHFRQFHSFREFERGVRSLRYG